MADSCPLCDIPGLKVRIGPIVFQADLLPGTICRLLASDGEEIAWTASPNPEQAIGSLGICGKHMSRLLKAVPTFWLN